MDHDMRKMRVLMTRNRDEAQRRLIRSLDAQDAPMSTPATERLVSSYVETKDYEKKWIEMMKKRNDRFSRRERKQALTAEK